MTHLPIVTRLGLSLGLLMILLGVGFAWAAETTDNQKVTVSPTIFEEKLKAGEQTTLLIDIRNGKPETKTFYLYGAEFNAPGDESAEPSFNDKPTDPNSIGQWFSFPQTKVEILQDKEITLKIGLKVPANASPGGHYGAVIFSEKPPGIDPNEGPTVGILQEMTVLLLVSIPGKINEAGKFIEFRPAQSIFWSDQVTLIARFENTGNIHLKPRGIVDIQSSSGQSVKSLELNTGGGNVLPDSIRKFEISWQPEKYFGLVPAFGQFQAKPLLGMGSFFILQDDLPTVSFWVLPANLLKNFFFVIVIFAIVFFGFFKVGQRHGRRRHQRR